MVCAECSQTVGTRLRREARRTVRTRQLRQRQMNSDTVKWGVLILVLVVLLGGDTLLSIL